MNAKPPRSAGLIACHLAGDARPVADVVGRDRLVGTERRVGGARPPCGRVGLGDGNDEEDVAFLLASVDLPKRLFWGVGERFTTPKRTGGTGCKKADQSLALKSEL